MTEGERIVAFFEGTGPDGRGRRLEDVLAFDDDALEYTHDFIQWLFPLRERSGANPSAPRLDDRAVAAFAQREDLRAALRRALERMLRFYGMERRDGRIVPAAGFERRSGWLVPGDHNHLRLTRMMISLRTLGLRDQARALFDALQELAANRPHAVSATTMAYWRDAINASRDE